MRSVGLHNSGLMVVSSDDEDSPLMQHLSEGMTIAKKSLPAYAANVPCLWCARVKSDHRLHGYRKNHCADTCILQHPYRVYVGHTCVGVLHPASLHASQTPVCTSIRSSMSHRPEKLQLNPVPIPSVAMFLRVRVHSHQHGSVDRPSD